MLGLENPTHLLIVLVVLLLLFGAKRLPEMGRSLGSSLAGFKDALTNPSPASVTRPANAQVAPTGPEQEQTPVAAGR